MRQAWWMLGLMLLAGCNDSGPPVDIVVPKGFTGPVWIVLDPESQDIPLINDRYKVVIPPDGVLRVRSFRPLQRWHKLSASYDDGSRLPQEFDANPAGPNLVALRGGGTTGVTTRDGKEFSWMQYFVGTAKQYSEWPMMDFPPGVGH
jgi:hypothetical protein